MNALPKTIKVQNIYKETFESLYVSLLPSVDSIYNHYMISTTSSNCPFIKTLVSGYLVFCNVIQIFSEVIFILNVKFNCSFITSQTLNIQPTLFPQMHLPYYSILSTNTWKKITQKTLISKQKQITEHTTNSQIKPVKAKYIIRLWSMYVIYELQLLCHSEIKT